MRHVRPLSALALALTLPVVSACAGPKAPFDVGTQSAPVDLVLGVHEAVVTAPVGPISAPIPPALAPYFPVTVPVAAKSTAPSPTPSPSPDLVKVKAPSPTPAPACPPFDPLSPVSAGGVTLDGPPQAGTYTYRATTSDTVGDQAAKYDGDSTWAVTVSDKDPTSGGYDVTIDVTVGSSKTSRVLRVLPQPIDTPESSLTGLGDPITTDPNYYLITDYNATAASIGLPPAPTVPNFGRYGLAGIYLVSQTSDDSTFTPQIPIPLLETPVDGPRTITGYGTDGTTSMLFTSTLTKKVNVNACGKKLESYEVQLTDGHIVTTGATTQDVDFTENLDFGLQFGGLPLHDDGTVSATVVPAGATAPETIARTFDFTTNTRPKPAKVS